MGSCKGWGQQRILLCVELAMLRGVDHGGGQRLMGVALVVEGRRSMSSVIRHHM
jgi:hypothetical protein